MNQETRAALDKLAEEVTEQTEVDQAVLTLLEGLKAQILKLQEGEDNPDVVAAINQAADIVSSHNEKFKAAVPANT